MIAENMALTEAQAKEFWPVYESYQIVAAVFSIQDFILRLQNAFDERALIQSEVWERAKA